MADPFRSDADILAMATAQAGVAGDPACRFVTGIVQIVNLSDVEAAPQLFPYDDPKQAVAMARQMSTCGLATERGWRFSGVIDPVLYLPYQQRVNRGQYAVVEEKALAERTGAWQSAIPWVEGTVLPGLGDAPIIGCKSCGSDWARGVTNTEHEYTLVAYDPVGGGVHHSGDGGQPGIAFRTRVFVEVWTGTDAQGRRTGELWSANVRADGTAAIAYDGRPQTGRRVVGFTRTSLLPLGQAEGPCIGSSLVSTVRRQAPRVLAVTAAGALVYLAARAALAGSGRSA